MEKTLEIVLVVGVIFIAAYALKINQDAINVMNKQNQAVQMMFVKS